MVGEQVGCAAGAEGGLRTLAAEGACQIGGFAGLQQHDADEEQADDNVHNEDQVVENCHDVWVAAFLVAGVSQVRQARIKPAA